MKRGREECHFSAPNSKHREPIPANRAQASVHDPISYFRLVKEVFKDNKEVSDDFRKLMHDYKTHSIDIPQLVSNINVLFKGHDDLILGFNAFLPNDIEVGDRPERLVYFEQAVDYVRKIKARFHDDEHSFHKFVEILYKYRNGNQCSQGVYEEVTQLLKNYPDLLEGFMCFLPENDVAFSIWQVKALPSTPPRVERVYKREIEDDFADDESSSNEADDPTYLSCITVKSDQGLAKKREKEKDRDNKKEKQLDKKTDGVERTLPSRKTVDLRMQSGEGSRVVAKSTSPRPLGEGFMNNYFQRQMDFLTLVQGKLPNEDSFQEILNLMNMHFDGHIARGDLDVRVGDMFQDCPELMSGFNDFVSQYTTMELNFLSSIQQGNLREQRDGEQQTRLREKSRKRVNGHLTSVREKSRKQDNDQWTREVELERKTEQDNESKKHSSMDVINHKSSHATNCSKYLNKPVSGLDLSKCEQCTPSYRLLPEDYPLPKVGSRTRLGHAILNDSWVSVTSGSEDYSFKQMRKNQYEETLFKCEDDRYELDMLLASFGAAIRSLEELLENIMNSDIKEGTHIDDYLTAIPLRCIERIYGDHGLDVLELMHQNPTVALPVILNRFKQKQDEWLKCQADMSKVWANVFAKNYHKSLDQGIFYFKQQDQKNSSTKALLAEIKEANAMKRKSNDFIISIACGNSMPIIPDLRLEYPDSGINDDLYEILKHSAKELCPNVEQSAKVLHVWKIFLEPLCYSFQESENILKCKSIKSQDIENEHSVKGFDENEKPCTQRFSEGSKNGESETGDNANYEDQEQRMNDGDAEETAVSDSGGLVNENRVLQRCMPLFSMGTPASFAPEGNTMVFYGSDNMYILLRLHQVLYECIHTAKVNAAATERKLREEKDESSFELYHKFLCALYGFLDGTSDSIEFEDVCRSIGGNKIYLFLTIDKLIFKFVKQLQAVASDEMAMKLIALHAYEQSHAPGGLIDAIYHANASMLLHDENVYRFEQRFEARQLFIQLMEGPLERGEALTSVMDSTFANNLSKFLLLNSLERSQRDPLFLKRNIVSCALDDDAQAGLLKDVHIANGLELSLSCSTYKIKYILNTEDILYRRKCKSSHPTTFGTSRLPCS